MEHKTQQSVAQFKNLQNMKRNLEMDIWQTSCCFLVLLACTSAFDVRDTFHLVSAEGFFQTLQFGPHPLLQGQPEPEPSGSGLPPPGPRGAADNFTISAVIGQKAALKCKFRSLVRPLLQSWKAETQTAHNCFMLISIDENKRFENCSKHINWTPVSTNYSTLYVNPVGIADDGLYTFDTAIPGEGTYNCYITLKVQVPPEVTLTTYSSRTAVCQAARGKPAANISWEPACEDCIVEYLPHRNRTVTVTSKYRARNDNETSVMCIVSHPTFPVPHTRFGALTAMKSSLSQITILVIRTIVILGLAMIVLTLACVFHRKLKKHRMKSPDEVGPPVDSNRSIHVESHP